MDLKLDKKSTKINAELIISGSKSESNRLLILQQLFENLQIENLSDAQDTILLKEILAHKAKIADVHHAGTAMRFLTAFFACQENEEIILKGSERMHQRPIKILVDALRNLGADIEYLENEGFPPLKIKGKKLDKSEVDIQGNVSSQYISALLLIACSLPNRLKINIIGQLASRPYLQMTLDLLNQIGIKTNFDKQIITVFPKEKIKSQKIIVESDWSSASYWYSVISLAELGSQITLSSYKKDSLQGDCSLVEIYKNFGVETIFLENKICIKKVAVPYCDTIVFNLENTPDIAQTIAVTCLGLGLECNLTGLHTLKIKETDRLLALKTELEKFSSEVEITENSLRLKSHSLKENVKIETYNDHRMAMAFAPLSLKVPLTILNAEVVRKSYPNFWQDFDLVFKNT